MLKQLLYIIFAGTSEFSAHHLQILINNNNYKIIYVITKPDKPVGRGNKIIFNAVKKIAKKYNLPILQPISSTDIKEYNKIINIKSDIMIVVSYGLIIPKFILEIPRFGCINIHCSLLPRWRGAAPVQRAIYSGDSKTGITIIQMDSGLDTGDILYQVSCNIEHKDNSVTLYNKLLLISLNILPMILKKIIFGNIIATPQDHTKATYAHKIKKEEAKLNWKLPAYILLNHINAFNPWPISYFFIHKQRIKVLLAEIDIKNNTSCIPGTILDVNRKSIYIATGDGILKILILQLSNRKIMHVKEFINAYYNLLPPGIVLE